MHLKATKDKETPREFLVKALKKLSRLASKMPQGGPHSTKGYKRYAKHKNREED